MSKSWLLCVLLGTLAWGQAAPSAPPPAAQMPPPAQADTSASVPDDAVVLTVIGVCPAQPSTAPKTAAGKTAASAKPATAKSSADCKTTITKAQFEKLAKVLVPSVTPQVRRQLASVLPRVMAMSDAAKKQGMDKTSDFKEHMRFVTMQVLSNDLQQKLQKESADVPEADIEKYYKDNPQNFEQYSVERIFVPRTKQSENEPKAEEEKDEKLTDEQKKAKEEAEKAKSEQAEQEMTKVAADLRERAAKGEDFATLEKAAYEAAGMKVDAPNVKMPDLRRTGLPPSHVSALDLKPGEVSSVISDNGGHYIYKLISKTEMPLDKARTEIHNRLQSDRMRESMEKLTNSFKTETNEAYFGPGAVGPMPPPHIPRPRPSALPVPPQSNAPQTPPAAQAPAAKPN